MVTCPVDVVSENYSATDGQAVVAVQLDGGPSRYRLDKIGAPAIIPVQWTVDIVGYNALRAFYASINQGADPFLINVIYEVGTPQQYVAHLVVGTWNLSKQEGNTYILQASLEVIPGGVPAVLTSQLPQKIVTLAGGNMVFDAANGQAFEVTLNADALINTFVHGAAGLFYTFAIKQDIVGAHAFVWPANVKNGGEVSAIASSCSVQTFYCNSDGNLYPVGPMTMS